MSGFLPASIAIRERLGRLRLVALLCGVCHGSVALAQIPVAPAEPWKLRRPDARPSRRPPRYERPVATLPADVPAPRSRLNQKINALARVAFEQRGRQARPLRYTLEAIALRGNTRTGRRVSALVRSNPATSSTSTTPRSSCRAFACSAPAFFATCSTRSRRARRVAWSSW